MSTPDSTNGAAVPDRELRPVPRYEWEQIITRARLGGLIGGNATGKRGGVSGATFKAVALVWSGHGNPDGSGIYPGDATLAVEAEVSLKVAQRVKTKMVELGLTERVRARSRRHHKADEYRLTLPSDLLDHVEVLTPAQVKLRAATEYEKRRGKRPTSDGPDPTGSPVGGPEDTPHDDEREEPATPPAAPAEPAPEPAPEPPHADSSQPGRPTGCPDHGPAMKAGTGPDGRPNCPLCRVGAPPTPTRRDRDGDPEADHARQRITDQWAAQGSRFRATAPDPPGTGNVIPFDRRRAS